MSPDRFRRALHLVIPPVIWLGVWQFAAMAVHMELKLPAPLSVLRALAGLVIQPLFWQSAAVSLARIFLGILWGTALGVLLAVLTSLSAWADRILSPIIRIIRATPVISFILLVWLWVSRVQVPTVISGLMVLPVVWGNVAKGILQTDPLLLEMARAYRFSRWNTLRLVYIPSVRPYFVSGLDTAMGLAWKSGVAAEAICLPPLALGSQIYYAKLYLESPELFAWTAVVIALSYALEKLVAHLFQTGRKEVAP